MHLAIELGRLQKSAIFERGFDFLGLKFNICVGQKHFSWNKKQCLRGAVIILFFAKL